MSDEFYLYRFEASSGQVFPYCNVTHPLTWQGDTYAASDTSHTAPTFSSDPSQARVQVRMRDSLDVALNYISHPPPYSTLLTIWEVRALSGLTVTEVAPYWHGQVVRVAWRDGFRLAELTCRTTWEIHSTRETMVESLNPLCRFHLGDGRCPVNIEDFKESVTVIDVSDDVSEPTVEVSGLAQSDTYYKAGMIRISDGDMRTVDKALTSGLNKVLTLSRAFPSTSLQIGDTVEVFAGDDLTLETCTVIFGAATNSGEAWGGWKLTPNRDYQKYGIR